MPALEASPTTELLLGDVDNALQQIAEELERTASLERSTEHAATMAAAEAAKGGPVNISIPSGLAGEASAATEQAAEDASGKPSEVSEIARKILETVGHEDSVKWRESSFLALMRDFRDGKKTIVADEIFVQDS
jgi:hypothetical protein